METYPQIRCRISHAVRLLFATSLLLAPLTASPPAAAATASVTIAGSLQSELGCVGDWEPACSNTFLAYDASDDVWQASFTVPAGSWDYKAALNGGWDENYGRNAAPGGDNIPLPLGVNTEVKFYYDDKSHWLTDNVNSVVATVPGSYQSELGCPGDWDPGCLRSWLQDADEDGIYAFSTTVLPPGNYETKVAIDESWSENYGAGGVQNGPNIPFSVVAPGSTVIFTYDSSTHVLTIGVVPPGHALDNEVALEGLRHDSRDTLYRTPGGAVAAGTPVTLRFRTFHKDVEEVTLRVYALEARAQRLETMALAAADVSCYQAGLEGESCDYWSFTLPNAQPDNLWYRFVVTDGSTTVYYADDTPALDGGPGSPSENMVDNDYALMIHDPAFTAPSWAKTAVVYQIFPDRFRSGRSDNNPRSGQPRYDDPVLKLPWNTLPEGYCRSYDDAGLNCPWRFGPVPPWGIGLPESPRGRDYMGGDVKGVDQRLEYLVSLGVNTLYLNPIFDSASNHGYDTQNYYKLDPYFGTPDDWTNLVKHAGRLGVRIVLDGVFNHLSSDSPFFDRYHRYPAAGACESVTSPYRGWFTFHDVAPGSGGCVGSGGALNAAIYDSWFGFDNLPVLDKSNPAVQAYFLTSPGSVSRVWLAGGAQGWRLDAMGDVSFPSGYWESFRQAVKDAKPSALIVGELWQKDSALLRSLRGDRADTATNYRLRDAVLGLLTPGPFDAKGFPDSGLEVSVSKVAARLAAIREDYPDAAYYSLMNLVDSHDTERILWAMTPGGATRADKEWDAANVAFGKRLQKIASLIQFTLPGAPTIYYGDEVALTGDDDPDNRRTYPWGDLGGLTDADMFAHYQKLATLRKQNAVLTAGDFRILLADDAAGVLAFGRKTVHRAALTVINRSEELRAVDIPLGGYIPDGSALSSLYDVGNVGSISPVVSGGRVSITLEPRSAWLLATGTVDLLPPPAPFNLQVAEANAQLDLSWGPVVGAAGYNLYRSPLSAGGWVKLNADPLADTQYSDTGVDNGRLYYYVATALDGPGNESAYSEEVSGMPHLAIGWANLQWPPTMNHVISAVDRTITAYGQVWIDGATSQPGATPGLRAQLGFGPAGSDPAGNPDWTWTEATFNVDAGNNDEFVASMLPEAVGTYDSLFRYSTTNGRDWLYADRNGPVPPGAYPPNPCVLTVMSSGDVTPPAVPANLHVVSSTASAIALAWDPLFGDASLYGYEILRGDASGGPYALLARLTAAEYTDGNVGEGATYFYVVRALDTSFNRSAYSSEVQAVAAPRTVTLVFNVTVPATTDATGSSVYIAGFLDRLDGGLPQWNPAGVALTPLDATHWTITLTGKESVQLEYRYSLGNWEHVEKGAACDEIANRTLTLSYGATGTMAVNDTVVNWRNVAPCGN